VVYVEIKDLSVSAQESGWLIKKVSQLRCLFFESGQVDSGHKECCHCEKGFSPTTLAPHAVQVSNLMFQ
jgi:hypothetical protein